MMRLILLVGILFVMDQLVNAQQFQFVHDSMDSKFESQIPELHCENRIANTGSTDEIVKWEATVLFKPASWLGVQVCDDKFCYPMAAYVTREFAIKANSSGLFKVTMFPNGVDSCAMVVATASKKGSTVVDDTSYYFYQNSVNSCLFTASSRKVSLVDVIKVFPNPATAYIQLNNTEPLLNLRILDQNGRTVYTTDQYNREAIQLSGFVPGNYFIMYELRNGKLGMSRFIRQ